jgi:hypothetical protein
MRPLIFVIALFALHPCLSGQGLDFYKENITLKIDSGFIYVSGIYYLRNNTKKGASLVYPFPVDPHYGKADSLLIVNLAAGEFIKPLKIGTGGAQFRVGPTLTGEVALQISYRQKLLASRAEYILKSTAGWKKPLDQANYQLILPANLRITKFSLPPQDSIVTDHEIVYTWYKQHYLPVENLIFEFVKRKQVQTPG